MPPLSPSDPYHSQGLDAALRPATVLDEMSRLVPTIARTDATDEATLASFGALWDEVSPQKGGGGGGSAGAAADATTTGGGAGAPASGGLDPSTALQSVQANAGPLLEQLSDPNSRLRHRLPMIGTLSRRFAQKLLRRVAQRLDDDASAPDAPELARSIAVRAAAADRSIADLLEPEQPPAARS